MRIGDSFPKREDARQELVNAGFKSAFSSPGRPELWIRGRERAAIRRSKLDVPDEDFVHTDYIWTVVPYPEPATCLPSELKGLTDRDGEVLHNGA